MIDWLIKPRASTYQGGIRPSEDNALYRLFGRTTRAGTAIGGENVDQISAFFCAVTKIADSLKLMPLNLHRKLAGGGSAMVSDKPAATLWKVKPNGETSCSRIKWLVGAWVLTWGNFYAEIQRNGFGEPMALWPIHPSRVQKKRLDSGAIVFYVMNSDGRITEIADRNMLHVYRYSKNGIHGMGSVSILRETLGSALAADEYAAKFFGNNAMPAHLIIREEDLDEESLKKFRAGWIEQNSGENSGGIHFLGGGSEATKIHTLTLNNADSQLLETRQFNISEVARTIPISPMMLYEYGRATWGNFYEVRAMYIGESVAPIALDLEGECDRKLLTEEERAAGHYFKCNPRGILRVESKEQYESFTSGLNNGFLCVDEVREFLDMNPLPDGQGQIYMRQGNMVSTAELAAKIDRLKAGKASAADVEFLREVVKAFIADGTIADVIANNTRFADLLDAVGIPRESKVADPFLPVIADNGQMVSGGTIKDSDGDVVGGDVVAPPGDGDPSGNPQDPAGPRKDGDDPTDQPAPTEDPSANREARAWANRTLGAAFEPVLQDAIDRMDTVAINALKRCAKAADPEAARKEFREKHVENCRVAFGPVFDGLAKALSIEDAAKVMEFTARVAAAHVHGGVAPGAAIGQYIMEFAT